jgi:hypothetical protein
MPPLVFSWPYGLIFLAVMFWAFAPEFRIISRQSEPATSAQDAGSKRAIANRPGPPKLAAFAIAASVPTDAGACGAGEGDGFEFEVK